MAVEFRCGRCGGKVPRSARVCLHCGAALQTRAFRLDRCRDCGQKLVPGQWFCRRCGRTEWGIILGLMIFGLACIIFAMMYLPLPGILMFVAGGVGAAAAFSAFFGIGGSLRWPPLRTAAMVLLVLVMVGGASFAARHRYSPETVIPQTPAAVVEAAMQTQTLVPTSTLAPSETPAPSPTPSIVGVIIPELANVRAAPALDAPVLDGAAKNEFVTILGRTGDGVWYKIKRESGVIGWVYFELIRLDATASQIPEVPAVAIPTP